MKSEWTKYCLGDLYEAHNGLSKGGKYFGSGYPFLTFSNVFNNWFIPDVLTNLVQSTEKEQEAYSIHYGDIFVTRTSETINELGMSSVALKDYPNATYNGFTKRLRPTTDKVLPEFIGYYLRCPFFRNKFKSFSNMTTRASLKNEDLLSMEIMLPSIEIQYKIASLLRNIDNIINENTKANSILTQQAQAIYKNMFVDTQDEWTNGVLSDIADITMGQSPKGDTYNEDKNGTVFFQGRAEFGFRFPTVRLYTTDPKRMAYKNDVLMSVRAPVGDVNIAHEDCCIGRGLAAIRSKTNNQSFVLYTILSLKNQLNIFNGEGTVFGSINREALNSLSIKIPPQNLIDEFENIVTTIDKIILSNHDEICRLQSLRDTLLPKLISGELDVSEVNI